MSTNKAKLSAAVAAKVTAAKKVAPKATAKPANNIDATFAILKKAGKKGIHIDLMAEELGVTVKLVRRLIDQVRSNRHHFVDRTARCTFTLGAKKA